jgi:hypothetical protein
VTWRSKASAIPISWSLACSVRRAAPIASPATGIVSSAPVTTPHPATNGVPAGSHFVELMILQSPVAPTDDDAGILQIELIALLQGERTETPPDTSGRF